uniref:Uncharacterized protein n=1 Tax=Brassica campestris TaxID=3711 RepID=M4DCE1_BRACM
MFGLLNKSKPQQDVYFPYKTVNQRKRQNKFDDDEAWVRSGDRPFTKAKRNNRVVFDKNELQTYVILEKMLHKAIHAIRQLKKKRNTNSSPAPNSKSIGANQHGDQDVLNNLTEVRSSDLTDQTDRAVPFRLELGWNHVQMTEPTEPTEPQSVFPDQLDVLRPTVEPDLAWVVKKPKTDMHFYPTDHPDSPASVLIFTHESI